MIEIVEVEFLVRFGLVASICRCQYILMGGGHADTLLWGQRQRDVGGTLGCLLIAEAILDVSMIFCPARSETICVAILVRAVEVDIVPRGVLRAALPHHSAEERPQRRESGERGESDEEAFDLALSLHIAWEGTRCTRCLYNVLYHVRCTSHITFEALYIFVRTA